MIVYFDTSSLVKLYVEEKFSGRVGDLLNKCDVAATSLIAYAEARAAFSGRFTEKSFSRTDYKRIVKGFNTDWADYLIVSVTNKLVLQAGELAEKYNLRGFDSIHLSSAITLKETTQSEIHFSCFDSKLNSVAKHVSLLLV